MKTMSHFLICIFLWQSAGVLGQKRMIPHIPPDDEVETIIRLANTAADHQSAVLTAFDEQGQEISNTLITLAGGETRSLDDVFAEEAAYVVMSGDEAVRASALYQPDRPNSTWAVVHESSEQTTLWRLYPSEPNKGRDQLAVVNTGYRDTTLTIALKRFPDATSVQKIQVSLARDHRKTFELNDLFPDTGGDPEDDESNLYYQISAPEPLAVTALGFNNNDRYIWENAALAVGPMPVIQMLDLLGQETYPEGVAIHRGTGDIFVGGLASGDIQRLVDGRAEYFKTAHQDGLQEVIGMTVDAARNRLWVCSSSFFELNLPEVVVFDIASGAVAGRFPIPDDGLFHFLNDITLDQDGNAYATDSLAPVIWKVDQQLTTLEKFVEDPDRFAIRRGFNLNGITTTPDGRFLMTAVPASAGSTLYRVDLASKEVVTVDIDGHFVGGDGLVFGENNELFSVLFEVSKLRMECDFTRATLTEFPEISPFLDGATTGKIFGGRLIVVNSQLDHLFTGDGLQEIPFTLTAVPLSLLK